MKVRLIIEADDSVMDDIAYECSEVPGVMDGLVLIDMIKEAARAASDGDTVLKIEDADSYEVESVVTDDDAIDEAAEECLGVTEGVDWSDLMGIFRAGVLWERARKK